MEEDEEKEEGVCEDSLKLPLLASNLVLFLLFSFLFLFSFVRSGVMKVERGVERLGGDVTKGRGRKNETTDKERRNIMYRIMYVELEMKNMCVCICMCICVRGGKGR